MLTYTKSIIETKPRLYIGYDQDSPSPRENDNLGYLLTKHSRYRSPDGKNLSLYDIMCRTENEATDSEHHIKLIKQEAKKEGIKITAIYPISIYEHSNIVYRLGAYTGWDDSNCGFYIVTDKTQKANGTETKEFKKIIEQELKDYTQWANGEIYAFILYDKEGEVLESCGGFYDTNDIREYLPKEFAKEDLSLYFNS